jgi:effector-binding domain-containing protein
MTSTTDEPQVIEVDELLTAVVTGVIDVGEMAAFFDRAFSTLGAVLDAQGVVPVGPAFALHRRPVTDSADLEVGFPTSDVVTNQDGVHASRLPGGRVARYVHQGSFDGLPGAWERLASWIEAQGLTPAGPVWEVYVTEPRPDMDPAELRTELVWPVA